MCDRGHLNRHERRAAKKPQRTPDEDGPGIAVRVSGDDVCRVLDVVKGMPPVDALSTLVMAVIQRSGRNEKRDPDTGQWAPMSAEELKTFLAALTSDMLDLANKSDLWRPLRRSGEA